MTTKPTQCAQGYECDACKPEMSLRDWFAGMALSPMLTTAYGSTPDILAKKAYEIADAMMREREAK